jgi:hypothetical protein
MGVFLLVGGRETLERLMRDVDYLMAGKFSSAGQ